MQMPDITKAQVVAIVGAIFGLLAAFGLPVGQDVQDAIVQVVTALAVVIPAADAFIRNGRSKVAAVEAAKRPAE
jgi:hypothetical protein